MNDDQFWTIIKQAQGTDIAENLKPILAKLPLKDIFSFGEILDGKIADLHRWDIWGIAYIVNGGCSDDGFEYFRCWVVAQGKEFYNKLATDPDDVFTDSDVSDCECEELGYVAGKVYKQVSKQEIPQISRKYVKDPSGESWEEDDLEELFPKTFAVYNE